MSTQEQPQKTSPRRIIPVTQWNDYHAWPPPGGLRYLIFHENSNGFSSCVVRVGRRVLIDEEAFFVWMESHKEGGNHV